MRSKSLRALLIALCAVAVIIGGLMMWRGLQTTPPAPTPTPDHEFSISPEEANQVDRETADAPIDTPDDLQPYANTEPITVPARGNPANYLYIPSLKVSAPIAAHGVTSENRMSLPDDLRVVGWLNTTSSLSADTGSSLLAGHVTVGQHTGALYYLGKAQPGATIVTVDDQQRHTTWVITSVRHVERTELPDEIFRLDGPRTLTLVTCGGELLRTSSGGWAYEDNIIVTAAPLTAASPTS